MESLKIRQRKSRHFKNSMNLINELSRTTKVPHKEVNFPKSIKNIQGHIDYLSNFLKNADQIDEHLYKQLSEDGHPIDQLLENNCIFDSFYADYLSLSTLISPKYTVIDLGCGNSAQGYFFKNHKKYIGVDIGELSKKNSTILDRFTFENSEHYIMDIMDFIKDYKDLENEDIFVICSYVPLSLENRKMINSIFPFIYHRYC